jgi:hypothetical protein
MDLTQIIAFLIATGLSAGMVFIVLRAALIPETRFTSWVRGITGPNGRYAFAVLLLLWFAGMAFLASLSLPANEAGGPALIGLFAGFFIFMGFIWAVIGE